MSFWTVIALPRAVHVICAEGNTHCTYNDRAAHAWQTHNRSLRRSNIVKAEGSMHCCWTIRDREKVPPWSFPRGPTRSTYDDVWLRFWSSDRPPRQKVTTNSIAYILYASVCDITAFDGIDRVTPRGPMYDILQYDYREEVVIGRDDSYQNSSISKFEILLAIRTETSFVKSTRQEPPLCHVSNLYRHFEISIK